MPDFADAVVSYFNEKYGKRVAYSAMDEQYILDLEDDEVPLDVVLRGIDQAFERKTEPPRSVRECKRWVTAELRAWRTEGAEPAGPDAAPTEPVAAQAEPERPEILDILARRVAESAGVVREAYARLLAEVSELLAEEGTLDSATLSALDTALAHLVHAALPDDERAEVDRDVALVLATLPDALGPQAREARRDAALFAAVAARHPLSSVLTELLGQPLR